MVAMETEHIIFEKKTKTFYFTDDEIALTYNYKTEAEVPVAILKCKLLFLDINL